MTLLAGLSTVEIARWCGNTIGYFFDIAVHTFQDTVFFKKSAEVKRHSSVTKEMCGQWQEGFTCLVHDWNHQCCANTSWFSPPPMFWNSTVSASKVWTSWLFWSYSWRSFKARHQFLRQSGKNNCCVLLFQLTGRWRTLADCTLESLILADYTLESVIVQPHLRVSWI